MSQIQPYFTTRSFIFLRALALSMLLLFTGRTDCNGQQAPVLTVYVFLNTECPISQQYTYRLADLYRHFAPLGVRFVGLFPLRTDSPAAIRQFRAEYKLPFPGKPDATGQARRYRVGVTPEVVVVESSGQIRYQGAIDNWYVDLGRHRTEATQTYLRDALNALLEGKPMLTSRTDAVGCLIE